jgi:cell division septum initiation protein DivIVA
MTNQHESFPDLMQEDSFEVVMRGYSRRQVHDYMIRSRNQIRDLEERLARAIDQAEQGRLELAEARRRMVEAPQSYEDLSPRLAQILKLGEEEAASKREDAETESIRVRESATLEAERMLSSARETSDTILTSAQAEAERRVAEATSAAERMLAQAGADAEETLTTARAESEETLRSARGEADRTLTTAKLEAEQTIESANAEAERVQAAARQEAESTVTGAQKAADAALADAEQRVAALDEHAGRRVSYLTDTHGEVVRRLNEITLVLGDLMGRENTSGPLLDEQPAAAEIEDVTVIVVDRPLDQPEAVEQGRVLSDDTEVDLTPLEEADDDPFPAREVTAGREARKG